MLYSSKSYALALKGDRVLFNRLLKYLNPRPEDKILEVGCSRGFLTKWMQTFSEDTTGIDINAEAILHGVTSKLRTMDATRLEFSSETFDKIYSCHTIEHIPDLKKSFQEMERVLKPAGQIVLVYPAEPVRGIFAVRASSIMLKNPFHCREVHLHKLNPKEIQKIIEGSELKHLESHFSFFVTPQYFTLLGKVAPHDSPHDTGAGNPAYTNSPSGLANNRSAIRRTPA